MKAVRGHIPSELYKKIQATMPVVCVDLVVIDGRGRFLLLKRKNDPERGTWWFPGGRVLKNERLAVAVIRKLYQETRLKGRIVKELGAREYFSREGYFRGISAHMLAIVYVVRVNSRGSVYPDAQSSGACWFRAVHPRWHSYVKGILKEARFRETAS